MQQYALQLEMFLSFVMAFLITYYSVPSIITLAKLKKLYDEPNHRKEHVTRIPTLGGLALFVGFFFSFVFWSAGLKITGFNAIVAALLILFVVGIKDDLFPMPAWKKLAAQILATLIVVIRGDIRITNLYGLLEIHDLPYWVTVVISTIAILTIMNGFNLIDGINGLAAGIGVIVLGTYAYWFYQMNDVVFVFLCLTLIGSLFAFLRYNFSTASIFMGDSGSLVLGYMISIITIRFIQESRVHEPNIFFSIAAAVYAFNLLIIPLFDTLRVFTVRLLKGRSPFAADRNHIHHTLIDIGLNHKQASLVLYAANIGFIVLAALLDQMLPREFLLLSLAVALLLSQIPFFIKMWLKANNRYKKNITAPGAV
ncbi:MAG: MraY family glycosyltransferase [Sphingobacteriaceae bacterium]|nr:MraY family glycosyltransferase [Sphingobacteriaceae bacterium]